MREPVILVCPVCASTLDAEADEGSQDFECVSCGQTWSMVVDAARHAIHSLT